MGTVVIVGGGTAGAAAAGLLRRLLGREHQCILLEKNPIVYNRAALTLLAVGRRNQGSMARSIARLNHRGIHVIIDEVIKIHPGTKTIYTENREVRYDLAIVAAGAALNNEGPPGLAAAGLNIHTLEGAAGICSRIQNFQGEEIAIITAGAPIKDPAAPYECAFLLEDWFKRRGRGKDVSISIFTNESAPLRQYGQKASDALMLLLLQRNIRVHLDSPVEQVDPDKQTFSLRHRTFPYDLLLYCPGVKAPPLIRESGLADAEGWLEVDPRFLAAKPEGIIGIGDVTRVLLPDGEELPKITGIARRQAQVAAYNTAKMFKGEKLGLPYNGQAEAILETGRGALFFSGSFYKPGVGLRVYPFSRAWGLLRKLLLERRWIKEH